LESDKDIESEIFFNLLRHWHFNRSATFDDAPYAALASPALRGGDAQGSLHRLWLDDLRESFRSRPGESGSGVLRRGWLLRDAHWRRHCRLVQQ
jgi:hypothetical protein